MSEKIFDFPPLVERRAQTKMSDWKTSWGSTSFGGVFWAEASKDSPIDELLAKVREGEKVSLERILDEQSVLQEVTAPNDELIQFLLEHLEEMLDYLTLGRRRTEPGPDEHFEHSSEHYAYISCEIFNVNNNSIINAVLKNEDNLARLFQILDQPPPLSPRSAGYFHMVLLLLCQREPATILRFVSRDRPNSFSLGPPALVNTAKNVSTSNGGSSAGAHPGETMSEQLSGAHQETAVGNTGATAKTLAERGSKRRQGDDDLVSSDEPGGKRAPAAQQASVLESISRVEPLSAGEPLLEQSSVNGQSTFAGTSAVSAHTLVAKRVNLGLVPAFLRHVDSYSIACAFMVLLQAAAEQADIAQDPTLSRSIQSMHISADLKTPKPSISAEESELMRARRLWTGGFGTASAVLAVLREKSDPYSHSNAADLLSELYRRAAGAKKLFVESLQMASLHVVDDEQQAPFAMNEDEFLARQQELTFADLKDFVSPVGSPSAEVPGEDWTLTGIDELCNLIIASKDLNSATDAATRVLSAVVIAYTQPFSGGDLFSSKKECCPEIERLVKRLPELVAKLTPEGDEQLLDTQWGGRIARLGMGRLLLVEVISHLILCGHKAVAKEMAYMDCDPVKALLDMFFKFEWNNVLHSIVERTIRAILQGNTPTVKSISALPFKDNQEQQLNTQKAEKERVSTVDALLPLQKSLFVSQPSLIERILDAYDSNAAAVRVVEERYVQTRQANDGGLNGESGTSGTRSAQSGQKGYMGHLRNIANACAEVIDAQNQNGGAIIDALSEELKQRWFDFVNGKLAECNQIVSKPLGGGPHMKKDPFQPSPVLASFSSPFGTGENFFSAKSKFGTERSRNLDFDLEPDLEDDDDDDEGEDEDPGEIMRRYNERKAAMEKESEAHLQAQTQVIASSPQDSSWVVDFGNEDSGSAPAASNASAGLDGASSPVFASATFDPGFFDPLGGEERVSDDVAASSSQEPFDPFASEAPAETGDVQDDADEFDPFGDEQQKAVASIPIKMPAPNKGAGDKVGQSKTSSGGEDLGVTPPGFEFID